MTRRRSSRPRPVVAPVPGLRLCQDIQQALLDLAADPTVPLVNLVNDSLRGALAYTAAAGETCQVAAAVDAVREAVRYLAAGHPEHAGTALEKALEFLPNRCFNR